MNTQNTMLQEYSEPAIFEQVQGQIKQWDKYEFIYLDHVLSPRLYYLRQGLVRLGSHMADGQETTFCILNEGSMFGNFRQQHHAEFAQAYTPVEVLVFSEWHIKLLLEQGADTVLRLFDLMGAQMQRITEQFRIFSHYNAHQRIVHMVLYLAEEYGYRHKGVTHISHHFTHADISCLTHTSRQTVTTVLSGLQQQGYLSYSRGQISIFRFEELEQSV